MAIKFKFDISLKNGDYSSKYFLTSTKILNEKKIENISLLRFKHFENNVVVAGIEECLQLIKFCLPENIYKKTKIYYLPDGTVTNNDDPILALEGDYKSFSFLENIIDSILSRRSSIATNVRNVVNLIGANNLIFMSDRSDDYSLQPYDGYAAYIGGARKFVTNKQVELIKQIYNDYSIVGTIPHALIQQYNGDLSTLLIDYKKIFPSNPTVALIDFNNNCLNEIQSLKNHNIKSIDFVRIDTSKKMIDASLLNEFNDSKDNSLFGVNHKLICNVRSKLNSCGFEKTKIIVSSGIDLNKIKEFIDKKTPIDIYGIGKHFLNINVNYTGDLVKTNGVYFAKTGRSENIDDKLQNMKKINN